MFKREKGRQGTGYLKMKLWSFSFPLKTDAYILKYPRGTEIPTNEDKITNFKHYRLNIVLKKAEEGGKFNSDGIVFQTGRIKLFRSDSPHSVEKITAGTRYILSFGFAVKDVVVD